MHYFFQCVIILMSVSNVYVEIPIEYSDDEYSYLVFKTYENDTYRNTMSSTIIDDVCLDLSGFLQSEDV